jgi:hypothetical protein
MPHKSDGFSPIIHHKALQCKISLLQFDEIMRIVITIVECIRAAA